MASYKIIQDFFNLKQDDQPVEPDLVSVDPYWIMAVVQFKHPNTYKRKAGASFTTFFPHAIAIRNTLIITSDCTNVSVSSTKNSHVSQLQATLLPGAVNYLNEIAPGDYIFCWMVNDKTSYENILTKLKEGKACNEWYDGLKFMGQAQNISKSLTQSPGGEKIVRYNLTGSGFTQFDTQLYYEPHLATAEGAKLLGYVWARYGIDINKIILEEGSGISVNAAIPVFLDLLLGRGINKNLGRENEDPRLRSTAGLEAPYSFMIPNQVGAILGRKSKSKEGGSLSYIDLLQVLIGVQRYQGVKDRLYTTNAYSSNDPRTIFLPDKTQRLKPSDLGTASMRFTGTSMLGNFTPTPPQFSNKPVWSILNQYLNPATNEMYTCLRIDDDKKVVPTLIVRQLPFTTSLYPGSLNVTKFLELPRWDIHNSLIRSVTLGKTDALRLNFIHVYGDPTNGFEKTTGPSQVVRSPPPRDDLDIGRSGLRGYFNTVPCNIQDIDAGEPKKWAEILSDILIGGHLTMGGTMSTVGIQAPVCIGDNIEYDGVILHIESVTHSCGISGTSKTFSTNFSLTHGIRSTPVKEDLELYVGTKASDVTRDDPGHTVEDERAAPILDPQAGGGFIGPEEQQQPGFIGPRK